MLVKSLAQCLACGKWLVDFASYCVWKHFVNWCVNLSYCSTGQGGSSQETKPDLENLKMNPEEIDLGSFCKCSPASGLNLHKARSLQNGAFL